MPSRFRNRKHIRFVDLPRSKRRSAVVRLGWQIARRIDQAGFWTDHFLEDPDEPNRIHRWVDVTFLGSDRFTLWNAEIITTQMALEDSIHSRAFNEAYALLSTVEAEVESRWEWKSVPLKHPGAMRTKELILPAARCYTQFDGRTFNQECLHREAQYLAESLPIIRERFTVDRTYVYGIGFYAVVAETNLNRTAIERTIQRFRDVGECDWQGV